MVNGVMHIVAAVLFAVVALDKNVNVIWMGIAGIYLITGIINLIIHALKVRRMEKAAKKAESEIAQKASSSQKEENITLGG